MKNKLQRGEIFQSRSKFNISLEIIFLIVNVYLFVCFRNLFPRFLKFIMVIYLFFDFITMLFREKIDKLINLDYDWISIVNYWSYVVLNTCMNVFGKVEIGFFIFVIIFLALYYRAYDLVYYSKLTPFSNKTLFLIFILILITITFMTDGIYNFLLAILTCIIGFIDVSSIQKLLNLDIEAGAEFDEGKLIRNKFSIIKILLVIYPAMGIGNYIIEKFHEFAGINYPNIGNTDMITAISLKLIIALICYVLISEIFSSKRLKTFIENSYIIKDKKDSTYKTAVEE